MAVLQDDVDVEYEEWKSVSVDGKKKMRIIKLSVKGTEFKSLMVMQYQLFLEHTERVSSQYKALHDLKKLCPQCEGRAKRHFQCKPKYHPSPGFGDIVKNAVTFRFATSLYLDVH